MTDQSANQLAVSRERAAQDLADITELRGNLAFNRYFARRLKAKRADVLKKFLRDACDPTQREAYRQVLLAYDDILDEMMNLDESSARSTLDQTPGVAPQIIPPSSGAAPKETERMIRPSDLPAG